MKRQLVRILVLACVAPMLLTACATTSNRVALYNGKNLDGWSVLNCDAVVDQGDILLQGGNGLVQSVEQYSDFILEFDWKALAEDNWDSGVYFRYTDVPDGRPWPARYQVNLLKGQEGNVGSIPEAKSEGMTKPGEWNTFILTVQGDQLSLDINGAPAWSASGLGESKPGYIALQAEVPKGGAFRFRNIYLTDLSKAE